MDVDRRALRRYEVTDEDERLWRPGLGDLVRLRTWSIFARFLPPSGRVLDVGGGPGTHAAHLAAEGYDVTLVDPVPRHVDRAHRRAEAPGAAPFAARLGTAGDLPADDRSVDAVLLMGPLYHLPERGDRLAALAEARRVLRPGGRLVAEVITRHAGVLDAALKRRLAPEQLADTARCVATGHSQAPGVDDDHAFHAWFHRVDDLRTELDDAGFDVVELVAVEGFAWLLGDLAERLADPGPLLEAVRLTESVPELLGCSAHVIGVATPC